MEGIQVDHAHPAPDVLMADASPPTEVEPAAAARPAEATGGGSSRSHLKRSLPADDDGSSSTLAPDVSSPASAAGAAGLARLSKRRGVRFGSKKSGTPALDDDGGYYGTGSARKSTPLAPFGETSAAAVATERAAKSEGRSRSLALAVAADGTPGDPKGKGKAIVHGGENKVVPNEDFCQVCQGKGRFICCDGCPHSFHLTCLDPPMDDDSVPDKDSLWFCRDCHMAQGHIPTPPPQQTIFGPLIAQLEETSPAQFQLPNEVKAYFKGVAVAPNGSYVDGDRIRPMKADRKGFAEERDLHRLKDAKGLDVLCYKCCGSAAPLEGAAELHAAPLSGRIGVEVSRWRKIISCDYCTLHWHFDCLDPPMTAVPQVTHKWMCPNHAEHVMPKSRVPKQGTVLVDVAGPGEFNNGHVEILPAPAAVERVKYEDVVLSTKRYRVPEASIIVDFWSKVLGRPRPTKVLSSKAAVSSAAKALANRSVSPLTSLGSESDGESDSDSVASSSDLSSLRSDAGESVANGSTRAVPAFPVSFSQLVDATILSPALDSTALPPAPPSPSKKIILRLSRSTGSGSPPKPDEPATDVAANGSATEPKPFGDEGVPSMVVGPPSLNGHAALSAESSLSADLASADEEIQMRAIRGLIKAKGKDKLLEFLQQS